MRCSRKTKQILSIVLNGILLFTAVQLFAAFEDLKLRTLGIEGDLTFNGIAHKLQPGWGLDGSGLAYNYHPDTATADAWSYLGGQTLNLNFGLKPTKQWYLNAGILVVGNYADRFWLPINQEHRLEAEGKKFLFMRTHNISPVRGEVAYKGDRLKISLFAGVGHYHWEAEGDLFKLYPEQFDLYNYLRISGRPIPRGINVKYYSPWGKLELAHGSEIVWGDKTSTYGKYTWRLGYFNNAFIFKDAEIDWGKEPRENLRVYELTSRVDVTEDFPMQFGFLYKPFRINNPYLFVEETSSNTNTYTIPNSTYTITTGTLNIQSGTTSQGDAFGYKARVGTTILPFIDELAFGYTHEGLTAGNKEEFTTELRREFNSYFKMDLLGIYQRPLIGPLPYLYEGTVDNRGPKVLGPRARNDAFWVTADNREGQIFKLTLNFDPTPSSRFYFWQPNILEEWNLNPGEDSTFAVALQYLGRKYTTTTDAWYYRNRDNLLLWEGEYDPTKEFWEYRPSGKWSFNSWIHSFNTMIRLIPAPLLKFWINLRWGQDIATGSFAYTTNTSENKAITDFFLATIWMEKKAYRAGFTYGKDVWGPEEWQQRFGGTNDRLYKFSLSRLWNKSPFPNTNSTLGIEYIGTREVDNLYRYPELGPFDEWRLFYTMHFSGSVVYKDEPKPKEEFTYVPPKVDLKILTPMFIPKSEEIPNAVFALRAKDQKGIKEWELTIYDGEENVIQTFHGEAMPPQMIEWNGADLASGAIAPEGEYVVVFKVTNVGGLSTETEAQTVTLKLPQVQVVKEIIEEIPEMEETPIEVQEEERGLIMNITSTVLFDFNKDDLKNEAIPVVDQVVKVLATYPQNKISIEGHTDSIGTVAYNQKLSEQRAQSVYSYLIQNGLSRERFRVFGFGETKPVDTNRTQEGRKRNRRVEIVILKETMERE